MKRPSNLALASVLTVDPHEVDLTSSISKRRRLVIGSHWEIKELPEMPYLYLKEKTSTVVLNDTAQNIANRIVTAATSMNCIGEYESDKARATLFLEDTEFCVQLFKVVTDKNDKEFSCIIVELRRLNGSSIVFHKSARKILAASKMDRISKGDTPHIPLKMKLIKRHNSNSRLKESDLFQRTIETVDTLLKKDRIDANLLGMESLQLITNTASASDNMVVFASNIVLHGSDFMDIKQKVSELITDPYDSDEDEDSIEAKYRHKMRTLAFTTLTNALDSMLQSNSWTDEFFEDAEWTGEEGLLAALLKEIENAAANPHGAYLAAKCLLVMITKSVTIKTKACQLGAVKAILQGQESWDSYLLLKNVAAELLRVLEDTK